MLTEAGGGVGRLQVPRASGWKGQAGPPRSLQREPGPATDTSLQDLWPPELAEVLERPRGRPPGVWEDPKAPSKRAAPRREGVSLGCSVHLGLRPLRARLTGAPHGPARECRLRNEPVLPRLGGNGPQTPRVPI